MGKAWHDDGRMMMKRNTFTDFIAVVEHLAGERYTSREQLVVAGTASAEAAASTGAQMILLDGRGGGRVLLVYGGPDNTSGECFASIDANGAVRIEGSGTAKSFDGLLDQYEAAAREPST